MLRLEAASTCFFCCFILALPVAKPLTGQYRTALERNIRGGFSISRADVAHHMLAMITQPETIRHAVGVAH